MHPSRRTPTNGTPSFTSNVSLPPSYQSDSPPQPSTAFPPLPNTRRSSTGHSSTTTSLHRTRYGEVSSAIHWQCCDSSFLLSPSVYYRVYSPAGGVKVKNPEFPEDPYLGRALAIRVTPPHTIASVKRHICGRENIVNHKNTRLFEKILSPTPLDDSMRVHIFNHAGVGSTSEEPVVLVMVEPGSQGHQFKLKANFDRKVNCHTS
jgi:hypothetical protein